MDQERIELIESNVKRLDWSMKGSASEFEVRSLACAVSGDVADLLAEVKRLQAKIRSGVEAAHDIQRGYIKVRDEEVDMSTFHHHSSMNDAAFFILEAMEEPRIFV